MKFSLVTAVALILSLSSCEPGCTKSSETPAPSSPKEGPPPQASASGRVGPVVDENYAFEIILKYEKFGPKVPGTPAHTQAGDWIVQELRGMGLTVHEQKTTTVTWDKKTIPVRNIIAQINPEAKTRYLLSAHWDNRPWADEDPKKENRNKPVPGVNDGGSGVAVLMSIAQAVSKEWFSLGSPYAKSSEKINPPFGIDFMFWDAEDWGNPRLEENTYCLGTQIWAKNPVPAGYSAKFGINYDMVGRIGSIFPMESYSLQKAPQVLQGLRDAAKVLGYQDMFPESQIGRIVDDHYFVTEGTGIPVVDLIFMDPYGRFPPEWHTVDDTSKVISRDVLKAVAQTTIQLLWSQK